MSNSPNKNPLLPDRLTVPQGFSTGYDRGDLTGVPKYDFYKDNTLTALTTSYQLFDFIDTVQQTEFESIGITLANDEMVDDIFISWDGVTLGGTIQQGETLAFPNRRERKVYIKGTTAGNKYRLWAW